MKHLSIIVPFAGEYPQALFTIQSIAQSLLGRLDFEIIAVDNYCWELEAQWHGIVAKALQKVTEQENDIESLKKIIDSTPYCMNNKAGEAIKAASKGNEWLKYMQYSQRLSHWECKRLACEQAEADTFLFIDSHCIPSSGIEKMYCDYDENYREIGTFHMPLTYKILEWRKLIYKMVIENEFYGYSFTSFREETDPYAVPCMSTCGMMISKEVYDRVGGWPVGMYAYGGGENFMNYALSVTGHDKYIYPEVTLHHHGEKRDYHWTYDGTLFNRFLAHYLFGGVAALGNLATVSKGRPEVVAKMVKSIVEQKEYKEHREVIKKNTTINLDSWVELWRH